MKYQVIWKDVDIVGELCVTCASANAMLPFFNLFLRGRVKIPRCLHCHSSGTAFDKNKEVYLRVRPDAVWAVFPREQEMKNEKTKWKKRKLRRMSVRVRTDTHLPTACPGRSSLSYLQHIVGKEYVAHKRCFCRHCVFFLFSVTSGDVQLTSQDLGMI